ncbi:speckle-type POZ protein-like [Leptopilina heterotoma]|uniref:speckle-type POZ protein-like n=1 Tax=Leptopilina heterotoma TaxID=63436 RepID=UPI001CA804C6|nr:speckle-type POZ protein-like [Leptopilina heterotoma]
MATVLNISEIMSTLNPHSNDDHVHVYWLEIRIPERAMDSGNCEASPKTNKTKHSLNCSLKFYKINKTISIYIKFSKLPSSHKFRVSCYGTNKEVMLSANQDTTIITENTFNFYTCIENLTINYDFNYFREMLMFCKIEEINVKILDVSIPKNIISKLLSLYEERKLTDFKIICEDQEFCVHKTILVCHSDVFQAMFENPMKESRENVLVISDFKPKIVETMIRYLYTEKMSADLSEDNLKQLLLIANKYNVESLKKNCLSEMCKLVNDFRKALDILLYVELYNFDDLRDLMIKYLKDNVHTLS